MWGRLARTRGSPAGEPALKPASFGSGQNPPHPCQNIAANRFPITALMHDLRYALRGLARSPGFAVAAILTLALGIGAVTSIFSVADAVLLRPLPYPHQDRLVMVWDELKNLGVD